MASAPHITHEDLLLMACRALIREPGEDHEARNARARCFVAQVCGFLDDKTGNDFARAIGFPFLVSTHTEVES